jgi:hypothetical protein
MLSNLAPTPESKGKRLFIQTKAAFSDWEKALDYNNEA